MRKFIEAVTEVVAMVVGYSIYSTDFNKQHFALTYKDALNWARCYPAGDFVTIRKCTTWSMVAVIGN